MDKLIDIFAGWGHFMQFIFLGVAGLSLIGTAVTLARLVVVLFRGWPPPNSPDVCDDEPEATKDTTG